MTSLKIFFYFSKLKKKSLKLDHLEPFEQWVSHLFSAMWKSSTSLSTTLIERVMARVSGVWDIFPTLRVSSGTPASTKPRKRSGYDATIKRALAIVFTSKDICCRFSTGKILSFTPGGVAKLQTSFFQYRVNTSSSTTIMRETFSFPAQDWLLDRGSNVHRYGILQLS